MYGAKLETQVISRIWTTEKHPDDWNVAVICPIHKSGDKQDCSKPVTTTEYPCSM